MLLDVEWIHACVNWTSDQTEFVLMSCSTDLLVSLNSRLQQSAHIAFSLVFS